MEFLNNIWIALTTPNAQLIDIISIPLTMLELYLTMELFISLLNIDSTKKQKIIYLAITYTVRSSLEFCSSKTL